MNMRHDHNKTCVWIMCFVGVLVVCTAVSSAGTVPLNLSIGKTVQMGKTPVKLEFEINYYVDHPGAFGPEWMIGFNVTPVVNNFVESWIKGQ